MVISKPAVGSSGWNTATDALIDAVNGTTSDVKTLARSVSDYGPDDQGFLGWTIDPAYATSSTAPTAGVLYVMRMRVVAAGTTDTVYLAAQTGGSSPTNGYVGLFNSSGTQIAVTTNQATSWGTAGHKAISWVTPVAVTPGTYYIGLLCGGGTAPAFVRAAQQSGGTGGSGVANVGMTAPFRFGTIGTGQTAMPSSVTLASVAGDNTAFFAAIST